MHLMMRKEDGVAGGQGGKEVGEAGKQDLVQLFGRVVVFIFS